MSEGDSKLQKDSEAGNLLHSSHKKKVWCDTLLVLCHEGFHDYFTILLHFTTFDNSNDLCMSYASHPNVTTISHNISCIDSPIFVF